MCNIIINKVIKMNLNISEQTLKNILLSNGSESKAAYIFTDVCQTLKLDIVNLLQANPQMNVIISSDSLKFLSELQLEEYQRKLIIESYITGLILNEAMNKYPNLIDHNLEYKISHILANPLDIDNLLFYGYLEFIAEDLKILDVQLNINLFINSPSNLIQRCLNNLLNDRYSFNTRFFIPNKELSSYYDDHGFMQETHDYHERSLASLTSLNQKTRMK